MKKVWTVLLFAILLSACSNNEASSEVSSEKITMNEVEESNNLYTTVSENKIKKNMSSEELSGESESEGEAETIRNKSDEYEQTIFLREVKERLLMADMSDEEAVKYKTAILEYQRILDSVNQNSEEAKEYLPEESEFMELDHYVYSLIEMDDDKIPELLLGYTNSDVNRTKFSIYKYDFELNSVELVRKEFYDISAGVKKEIHQTYASKEDNGLLFKETGDMSPYFWYYRASLEGNELVTNKIGVSAFKYRSGWEEEMRPINWIDTKDKSGLSLEQRITRLASKNNKENFPRLDVPVEPLKITDPDNYIFTGRVLMMDECEFMDYLDLPGERHYSSDKRCLLDLGTEYDVIGDDVNHLFKPKPTRMIKLNSCINDYVNIQDFEGLTISVYAPNLSWPSDKRGFGLLPNAFDFEILVPSRPN